MIEQFIEFLLTPVIIVLFQIVLLLVNIHVNKESSTVILPILWLLATIIYFPILSFISSAFSDVFSLMLLLFSIFLIQLYVNIEKILYIQKQEKNKYN